MTEMLLRCPGIKSLDSELEVDRTGLDARILLFALSPAEIVIPSNETLSSPTGLSSEYKRSYLVSKLESIRTDNCNRFSVDLLPESRNPIPAKNIG